MMQLRTYLLFPLLAGGVAVASPSAPETAQLSPQLNDAASILGLFVESVPQASHEAATDSVGEILVVDRHDRQCRREQRRASRYDYDRDDYPRFQFHYYSGRDRDDWDDDDWDDDDWDDDDDRRRYYYRSAPAPYYYYSRPRYYYYRH